MSTPYRSASRSPRRVVYGLLAPAVSATIALLIANGVAEPYPNLRLAYLICVAVGVSGLVQLIIGITEQRARE